MKNYLVIAAAALLPALFVSMPARAWNGPVNAACSVTLPNGTTVSGTQGWSLSSTQSGTGYWTCCLPGTSCVGRNKPAEKPVIGNIHVEQTPRTASTKPMSATAVRETSVAQPMTEASSPKPERAGNE